MDELLYATAGPIATITFNRPQSRNALTWAMYNALVESIAKAAEDPAVKAVILTGAGEKAFAAGTDIGQFRAFRTPQDAIGYERRIDEVLNALEACAKPTIAAIAGACTGGGAAIAACCDLRIAAAGARFGFPIARTLGNCLSMASLSRLSALLGAGRIKELIFTARLFEASEALSLGLLSEVLPDHAALQARALELAHGVGGNAPLTLAATKAQLRLLRGAVDEDESIILMCYRSNDFREGMDAFLAKRPPVWTGH